MTIVAPVGRFSKYEINIPKITESTEISVEIRIVSLNPLDTKRAVTVGKIIILEINIVPTTLIPRTTVIEVKTEIKYLLLSVSIPSLANTPMIWLLAPHRLE